MYFITMLFFKKGHRVWGQVYWGLLWILLPLSSTNSLLCFLISKVSIRLDHPSPRLTEKLQSELWKRRQADPVRKPPRWHVPEDQGFLLTIQCCWQRNWAYMFNESSLKKKKCYSMVNFVFVRIPIIISGVLFKPEDLLISTSDFHLDFSSLII